LLKYLIVGFIFLIPLEGVRAGDAVSPGVLEGHLRIVAPKPVEFAGASPSKSVAVDYGDSPLVILSREGQKEIARVTVDQDGIYHVALPPGDYVLDAKGRAPGHVRAIPQRFTVVSNQTVHVDFDLDTGIR
jgi:hypothetical protein